MFISLSWYYCFAELDVCKIIKLISICYTITFFVFIVFYWGYINTAYTNLAWFYKREILRKRIVALKFVNRCILKRIITSDKTSGYSLNSRAGIVLSRYKTNRRRYFTFTCIGGLRIIDSDINRTAGYRWQQSEMHSSFPPRTQKVAYGLFESLVFVRLSRPPLLTRLHVCVWVCKRVNSESARHARLITISFWQKYICVCMCVCVPVSRKKCLQNWGHLITQQRIGVGRRFSVFKLQSRHRSRGRMLEINYDDIFLCFSLCCSRINVLDVCAVQSWVRVWPSGKPDKRQTWR